MSKYILFIFSFCFELVNLNSNSLKSNIYNNQKQEEFHFNNTNLISIYATETEENTSDDPVYIIFIIFHCILSLINIIFISIRLYRICKQKSEYDEYFETNDIEQKDEKKDEKELLLINKADYDDNKIDDVYSEGKFKKDFSCTELDEIGTIDIINYPNEKKTSDYLNDTEEILLYGLYCNFSCYLCIDLFSFPFIAPYKGHLLTPCLIAYFLSIYLSLVHINLGFCRLYNNTDIADLTGLFDLISISKDFKEGNYFVPYIGSIDISGILSLESNRVYNLEFNGIIYCKHKNNLYKNLWMSKDLFFEGYHFFLIILIFGCLSTYSL